MAVTAKMVKELREMTGAGMMDCKKALNRTRWKYGCSNRILKKKWSGKS